MGLLKWPQANHVLIAHCLTDKPQSHLNYPACSFEGLMYYNIEKGTAANPSFPLHIYTLHLAFLSYIGGGCGIASC